MHTLKKTDRLIPAGLVLLITLPVVAGTLRLVQLSGVPVTLPDTDRITSAPSGALILHIVSVSIYCVMGAFQFSAYIRKYKPSFHRTSGLLLIIFGLLSALSGLWLNQFFPPAEHDGPVLYAARILVGFSMCAFIILGLHHIHNRNISSHRAYMMRAYALGMGAGTQPFIFLFWTLTADEIGEYSRAFILISGWVINLMIAEYILYAYPLKTKEA